MKLQTKQLRQFKSISGSLKQNSTLPILSYLKFEDGYITKNNLESFVTMEADFKGSCLIDENILMSVVNSTSEQEIEVVIKKDIVILKYGQSQISSPTEDISGFPVNIEPGGNKVELTKEILDQIKIAFLFTEEVQNFAYAGVVFVGNRLVAACNNYIAYTKIFEGETPVNAALAQ
jgi:DNA polymerase III sliding clamp (beta) subunit (PCNA family)